MKGFGDVLPHAAAEVLKGMDEESGWVTKDNFLTCLKLSNSGGFVACAELYAICDLCSHFSLSALSFYIQESKDKEIPCVEIVHYFQTLLL